MSCSRYSVQLSWLLDGELPPREAEDVWSHVAQCANCRLELEHWRRQGAHLRGHLKRHALTDEFVARVVNAAAQNEPRTAPVKSRDAGSLTLMRWLPIAAAVLVGIIIFSFVTPFKGSIGYARVLGPGERLEVMNSGSTTWVRTIAGEILHPGDWLRNPAADSGVILWRDSCRLKFEPGTLAQIPENPLQPVDRISLVRGVVNAEVQGTNRQFQVRTPSGDITAFEGGFAIHSGDLFLPAYQASADGAEISRGTTTPFTALNVLQGRARIKTAAIERDVAAGETIVFTSSVAVSATPQLESVDASLKLQASPAPTSELSTALLDTGNGAHLELRLSDVRLNKLLEYETGYAVRGGDGLSVSGSLSVLPGAGPQSIASRVGAALGVPLSFRQEKTRRLVASLPQDRPRSDSSQGSYAVEKTPDGLLNIDFRGVPAARAFSVLRSAVEGLPELSAGSAAVPIDLHASALKPHDAAAWIVQALGLQVSEDDFLENVLEVSVPAPPTETAVSGKPQTTADGKPQSDVTRRDDPQSGTTTRQFAPDNDPLVQDNQLANARTLSAELLPDNASDDVDVGLRWPALYPSAGLPGSAGASVTGKVSQKSYEFLGGTAAGKRMPSTHLVWPPIGDGDPASLNYLLSNPMGLPAHTQWKGFDGQGSLVAEYEVVVGKSSTLVLNLRSDLPAVLDPAGHWEMWSNLPLSGALGGDGHGDVPPGAPLGTEQLPARWTLPAWWLTDFGCRFWLANAGPSTAEATLTLVLGERVLSAERVIISSHGALIWPDLSSTMDFAAATGATVEIETVRGSIAAGLVR